MKQLDSYSLMIVANYFKTKEDFINVQLVCKKFKETSEKFHYNPIPLDKSSRKLFPNLETLHLYSKTSEQFSDGRIFRNVLLYTVDYNEFLKQKELGNICKNVEYTKMNRIQYGLEIPENVNILGERCFSHCQQVEEIKIPKNIQIVKHGCFDGCENLKSIDIPFTVTTIGNFCFTNCCSLTYLSLPMSVHKLDEFCFYGCDKLKTISSSNNVC